jgi:hypothetical protein
MVSNENICFFFVGKVASLKFFVCILLIWFHFKFFFLLYCALIKSKFDFNFKKNPKISLEMSEKGYKILFFEKSWNISILKFGYDWSYELMWAVKFANSKRIFIFFFTFSWGFFWKLPCIFFDIFLLILFWILNYV